MYKWWEKNPQNKHNAVTLFFSTKKYWQKYTICPFFREEKLQNQILELKVSQFFNLTFEECLNPDLFIYLCM